MTRDMIFNDLGGIERRVWGSIVTLTCEREGYQAEADKDLEGLGEHDCFLIPDRTTGNRLKLTRESEGK